MWRILGVLLVGTLGPALSAIAQISPGQTAADDYEIQSKKETQSAYAAWIGETDPVKKQDAAFTLLDTAVKSGDKDIVRELLRGGPHQEHALPLPKKTDSISAQPLFTLPDANPTDDSSQYFHSQSPIFRRMTADCFEAWTATDGWLFDAKGRLLHHVHVPRRDGTGREWFGAFLPSGCWITTDLWEDDRQLNCFDAKDKWLWELRGANMVSASTGPDDETEEPIRWARCDKMGKGWVACPGFEDPNYAWVSPEGLSHPISQNNPWALTYPRAMQAKGTYLELSISSDDGKRTLTQNSAGHGNWIDFPSYRVPEWSGNTVIPEGDAYFGFWPHSHAAWVETAHQTWGTDGKIESEEKKTWFVDENGKYQSEIAAAWLGDAADGKSLLLQDSLHRVITVTRQGPTRARQFHDGATLLQPVALYDDLHLGFFLNSDKSVLILEKFQ